MTDEHFADPSMPLSAAVFRLQYEVAADRGTRKSFLSECLAARRESQGVLIYDPLLADGFGGLLTSAVVDFQSGHFVYVWTEPTGFQRKLHARPWNMAGSSPQFDLGESAWAHLCECADQVWRRLVADFYRHVEKGVVVVTARPDSIFAESREIPADSWAAITVEDWELGLGSASSGEKLLGLRARLRQSAAAPDRQTDIHDPAADDLATFPSLQRSAGRPSNKFIRAKNALKRAYPNGVPALANKSDDALCADVLKHIDNPIDPPKKDTIKRAAGRR